MPGARLTVEQRRTIERCYRIGLSQGQIASIIGKSPATVSRELARSFSAPGTRSPKGRTARAGGQGYRRVYDAERAHRFATVKARRPKRRRLDNGRLRAKVWELLRADWSPEQIAAMLPVLFPHDLDMRVSHETIYQSLFVQTKGELKRELTAHLRSRRTRAFSGSRISGRRLGCGLRSRSSIHRLGTDSLGLFRLGSRRHNELGMRNRWSDFGYGGRRGFRKRRQGNIRDPVAPATGGRGAASESERVAGSQRATPKPFSIRHQQAQHHTMQHQRCREPAPAARAAPADPRRGGGARNGAGVVG